MPGTLTWLPVVEIDGSKPSSEDNQDHPMRTMTRRAAGLAGPAWDDQARVEVATLFDQLAPEWHTRTSPQRDRIVADALDRGLPDLGRADICVELGSGIGAYTPAFSQHWHRVVAVDLAMEMLRLAPPGMGHRLLADGARLPFADGVASAVCLVNCFLFPAEVDRVLGPDGVVVWVNSSGAQTPIHLVADEVLEALPGEWTGVAGGAGVGLWCVLRRA